MTLERPAIYVAITNHGFGHATRTAAVAAEIQRQMPEVLLILVTGAPRWLLESYIPGDFIHRPRSLDVGVIQQDSLTMDKSATLAKWQEIRANQRSLIAAEVNFIQLNRVKLILADIPPMAAPIAQAAGIPCWMISNFGWDLIYRDWGGDFIELADWIGDCFQQCDRLFRLPFHEPMSAFPQVEDVGLTGADPRYPPDHLRTKLKVASPPERTVLLTFGGLGLDQIPYANLQQFPDWQFLTFDRNAPDLPNLLPITDRHYRPVDLMPLCGRIVSKPGYGTFAEACRQGIPIVSLAREGFAEAWYLLEGIQNYAYHQILQPQEFFASDWEFLRQPLHPPCLAQSLTRDGNEAIATAVVSYIKEN